ncbi:putative polyketide synthase [Xylaria palmicola]|nr:putative polyketide synthase [Xylaria palmicola]
MAQTEDRDSIAITGLACRFPGNGNTLEGFWESICAGESAWSETPRERFNMEAFWSPNKRRNTSAAMGAHFLKQDFSRFDAGFFGLPKHDADAIDPQQRVMMEVAYEALERAGLPLDKLTGTRTGVYMGHLTSDYRDMICRNPDDAPLYTFTGTGTASLANRISWLWDLRGPSFPINTACSSSLVALHLACQSLRTRETDIAIVGGSSFLMNPEMFMFLSNQGFLSPDGKCKSFDAAADGYGRGEGFGCIILKRIDDAVSAGDPIRAVIRGTGSNQDGRTKGLTMPSAEAQMALIDEVYRQAGLDFASTSYVEAHGTGTKIGDSQEMAALAGTIGTSHSAENKLVVGSVKSNIGHLEAAAGVAGIIKAVLMLESGLIPPNIHFKRGNPEIKFDEWNVTVPTELTPWPSDGLRRISVNSFGYGGSNAHVILDDAHHYLGVSKLANGLTTNGITANGVTTNGHTTNGHATNGHTPDPNHPEHRLFVWSAQDKDGLQRIKKPLAEYIRAKTAQFQDQDGKMENFMANLAYTLSERRSRLQWKTFAVASSPKELADALDASGEENHAPAVQSSRTPRIGFVFTGQGAQWPRMGAELMEYSAFRESVEAADRHLREACGCPWSPAEELLKNKSASLMNKAGYSHSLSTILQVALVDLLRTWNIMPTAVVGHSGGEMGASYASGAMSRESTWEIGYYRGVIAAAVRTRAPKLRGSMMAVGLSHTEAELWISKVTDGHLVVACINSPTSTTIAGDGAGVDQLLGWLNAEGIFARKLVVDTAYHSPHMAVVADYYRELTSNIRPVDTPTDGCLMYSTVTGSFVEPGRVDIDHWVASLTSPVRFSEALYNMVRPIRDGKRADENAVDVLLELGPHPALRGPSTQTLKKHGISLPYHTVVIRNQNAIVTALGAAGMLFAEGCKVDIRGVNGDRHTRFSSPLVDLPTYRWNHSQRFWHDSRVDKEYLSREAPKPGLLGAPSHSVTAGERLWKGFVRLSEAPWIADHKIQGAILYPGAGYIAMALEAAAQTADPTRQIAAFTLREIQLTAATIVTEESDLECIVQLRPYVAGTRASASAWTQFTVTTAPDGKALVQNCCGLLMIEYEPAEETDVRRERTLEQQALKAQYVEAQHVCVDRLNPSGLYEDMRSWGLDYGPVFANVTEARCRDGQSVCAVNIPELPMPGHEQSQTPPGRPHIIHPGTLDAIFHMAFAAVKGGAFEPSTAMVPKFIDGITISASIPFKPGTRLPGFSNASRHGLNELTADIVVFDDHAELPVINIEGFLCVEIAGASQDSSKSIASKLVWKPAVDLLSRNELDLVLSGLTGEHRLFKYLDLLHHSNPDLSVLEVAPGAGKEDPMMTEISPLFQRGELARLACTWDVTVGYRDELQDKSKTVSNVSLKKLDFGRDNDADIIEGQYDLLVATEDSLRTFAPDVPEAVVGMCRALREHGTLCVLATHSFLTSVRPVLANSNMENTTYPTADAGSGLIIAKKRSITTTNRTSNGFTNGVVNGFSNGITNGHTNRITNGVAGNERTQITIVQAAKPTGAATALAARLATTLEEHDFETCKFSWGSDVSALAGKSCISLLEFQKPLLRDLAEEDFASVKSLLLESEELFWVTALDEPSAAMIDGLTRVVRNETPGLKVRVFHADEPLSLSLPVEYLADKMAKAFLSTGPDNEFQVRDGLLHVCRVGEDAELNQEINGLLPGAAKIASSLPLGEVRDPVKLCVQSPGMLSSVCLEPDDSAKLDLEPDFVEIQTKATGINFREIMVAMGQMADTALGLDAAGVICRVGSAVTKFKPGDKVIMYGYGAHRNMHRSRADFCTLIPEGMSFEQGASIPTVHATAWNALVRVAKVQKGQSILIHAAAGGVGQVAVQIAMHCGLEVFATVSSEAKRKLIRDQYGVLDDHIFNSRDLGFVKGIKRMTSGRGVDVVLNSLAGETLRQTWHCIAPFGHFIEIGIRDILDNTGLDMRPFMQDATFTFFNLRHVDESRPDLMATILEGAYDLVRRGITRPVEPVTTFPVSDVEGAMRLMQTGKHLGKIALSWGEDCVVPVLQWGVRAPSLSVDGVYLLVGGLGGLGRSVAHKLVELGARRLCFLSRAGAQSAMAQDLVRKLEQQQVKVAVYKCDVGNERSVVSAIQDCTHKLGRIRGVFQCAMVLRDGLFANMTHRQWIESTRPKVQGSWNLHTHLPDNLDFFITLSSFTGVFGSRGQSNYSAAGTYEDALAHYRRARGRHAITIDLGLMRDIGVLAETGMTDAFREWEKPYGIRENEFLALIERVIDRDMAGTASPQVVTGLATGGSARLAGISAPYYLDDARFSIMARDGLRDSTSVASGNTDAPAHTLVGRAKTLQEAAGSVLEALLRQVAKMLQTDTTEINTDRFLHSFGIDSLVAIEIVNWVKREAKATITVFDVLAAIPISTLCSQIAVKSMALPKELIPL